MKNTLFRKSLTIIIIALFSIIYVMPVIANESIIENKNENIILEYAAIDLQGSTYLEQISLSENELSNIQNKLSIIFEELQLKDNNEETINFLKSYLDVNEYPILSRIFSNLLNSDIIGKRKLVISQGCMLSL